ncbi:DUF4399 domain-containing protein [Marinobacter sp. M216]|uniref:DUF4399 domain-containing protein n=1 Tax=Marinobacter albus TaxID=3030833 RepID=A0ABT7H6M3_9GAMM|nr:MULTISPECIES: DUF4399 domain-containing protein [unclassified Marinobacter]MBW7471678.1 DUF4399 domain-containing protein [Marinobacter sp. F4218]MDK9556003.1 DUF4399 domain-containing protein [Marinobacter sp. M216]
MKRIAIVLFSTLVLAPVHAFAEEMRSQAPENAEAYFVQPDDGATVEGTFKVVFGLRNMEVAPAGVEKEGTGHHHLLIDTDVPTDLSQPLPATDQVRHFGGGQTETELTLPPGEHTLQLLLGNHVHVPHNPPVMSEQITITVE